MRLSNLTKSEIKVAKSLDSFLEKNGSSLDEFLFILKNFKALKEEFENESKLINEFIANNEKGNAKPTILEDYEEFNPHKGVN